MTNTSPIQSYRSSIKNSMVVSGLSISALALSQLPIIKAQLPIYMSSQVHQTWEEQAPKPQDGISVPYFTFDPHTCSTQGLDIEGLREFASGKVKPVFDNTGKQFGEVQLMQIGDSTQVGFRVTDECLKRVGQQAHSEG